MQTKTIRTYKTQTPNFLTQQPILRNTPMQHAARLRDACEIDGVHIFEDIVDDLRGETNQRICHILSFASLSLSLTLSPKFAVKNPKIPGGGEKVDRDANEQISVRFGMFCCGGERTVLRTENNDARCQTTPTLIPRPSSEPLSPGR